MPTDILQAAVIQSMARNLSVADLIRTVETLRQSGQAKSVETLYSTWIDHNADNPLLYAVLFNYSVVLSDANRLEPARDCLQRAIALNPDFMPAYINLGRVYERQGNAGTALVQWSAALTRMAPVSGQAISYKTTALNQSARALEAANQDQAAEEMLRQSLDIDPHQREAAQHFVALRQRQCEWPILTPWDRVTQRVLINGMSPLSAGAFTDDPILQMAMAWNYNKSDVAEPPAPIATFKPAPGERRLRVGYLSSDLREHAVGYLMAEVLALHDRSKVEVFAYYCGPEAKDPLHLHFKATADHWTSITGLDDATAAKKIAADKIDILVDLNGYTREARVNVIALRPAPVIVNWLGYPGTMGSPYHHYIIADDWIIPPDHELYYSEKVLRLPCYQPNNRKRGVAKRPSRAETGLPDNAFVFCCFNGAHKISRFTFDRWLMIIERVPNSVLWLLSSTEQADKRLREYAAARGIAPERVIFAQKLANPFHLVRYPLADLFLDSAPYGAHTTGSDALWMGVPVLTLTGKSFASRVCGSLVRSAGIPEMVCETAAEFVQRAIDYGNDPGLLKPIAEKLRAGRDASVLFDTPALVKSLEELYAQMRGDFESGNLPKPDLTNLDVYLETGGRVNHEEIEVQTMDNYLDWWRQRLAQRHALRPIPADKRLACW